MQPALAQILCFQYYSHQYFPKYSHGLIYCYLQARVLLCSIQANIQTVELDPVSVKAHVPDLHLLLTPLEETNSSPKAGPVTRLNNCSGYQFNHQEIPYIMSPRRFLLDFSKPISTVCILYGRYYTSLYIPPWTTAVRTWAPYPLFSFCGCPTKTHDFRRDLPAV